MVLKSVQLRAADGRGAGPLPQGSGGAGQPSQAPRLVLAVRRPPGSTCGRCSSTAPISSCSDPASSLLALGLLITIPVTTGPVTVGPITLSLTSQFIGVLLAIVGLQGYLLGNAWPGFSSTTRAPRTDRLLRTFSLHPCGLCFRWNLSRRRRNGSAARGAIHPERPESARPFDGELPGRDRVVPHGGRVQHLRLHAADTCRGGGDPYPATRHDRAVDVVCDRTHRRHRSTASAAGCRPRRCARCSATRRGCGPPTSVAASTPRWAGSCSDRRRNLLLVDLSIDPDVAAPANATRLEGRLPDDPRTSYPTDRSTP